MFLSDNGGCPFERSRNTHLPPWDPGSYWTYDKSWAGACNTPFRWYKQNQHEGGISTPMIAHWPEGITAKAGSITDQPGHLIDIMATCLDLGDADYPKQFNGGPVQPLRGKSLLPILQGKEREGHEAIYFQFSNNRAIRMGDWKLVSARGGPWELYDLSVDRTELNNLIESQPERAKAMAERWDAWWQAADQKPWGGGQKKGKGAKKKDCRWTYSLVAYQRKENPPCGPWTLNPPCE